MKMKMEKDHKIKLDGLAARVFLHEYDHYRELFYSRDNAIIIIL